ncbi:MAG: hypothetical protein ACFFER_07380 [Candidatus Thorarchaeota archaeon]
MTYKLNPKIKKLFAEMRDTSTAFIIGSRMSSVTDAFWKMWNRRKRITRKEFAKLFEYGGIRYAPEIGTEALPHLANELIAPLLLVFNYNCHIELCFSLCETGYSSISYDGRFHNVITETDQPRCTILKPHGSSRLSEPPTSIVEPSETPDRNLSALSKFVEQIEKEEIAQVVILAWSGNHDPYVEPYLQQLKNDLGVRFIHVDKFRESFVPTTPYEWGIVERGDVIQYLKDGATDFLVGFAKENADVDVPCTTLHNHPLLKINEHLAKHPLKSKRVAV